MDKQKPQQINISLDNLLVISDTIYCVLTDLNKQIFIERGDTTILDNLLKPAKELLDFDLDNWSTFVSHGEIFDKVMKKRKEIQGNQFSDYYFTEFFQDDQSNLWALFPVSM